MRCCGSVGWAGGAGGCAEERVTGTGGGTGGGVDERVGGGGGEVSERENC